MALSFKTHTFSSTKFCKINLSRRVQNDQGWCQSCAHLRLSRQNAHLYHACCLICCAKAFCGRRFPRMTSIQGQSGQEDNLDCFWMTADANIGFVTQYLANNRIFGDDLVDFSCKVNLPVKTQWRKFSFDNYALICLKTMEYGSLSCKQMLCFKLSIKRWKILDNEREACGVSQNLLLYTLQMFWTQNHNLQQ